MAVSDLQGLRTSVGGAWTRGKWELWGAVEQEGEALRACLGEDGMGKTLWRTQQWVREDEGVGSVLVQLRKRRVKEKSLSLETDWKKF